MLQKLLAFIKKNKLVLLIILAVVLYVITKFIPEEKVENKQETQIPQAVIWNSITLGQSTSENVIEKLGQPLKTTEQETNKVLNYKSKNPNIDNQVFVDNNENKVVLIKEAIASNEERNAKEVIDKFGVSSNIFFESGDFYSAPSYYFYVYPSEGIAYIGHVTTGDLLEVWYFKPTTLEEFKNIWIPGFQQADPKNL